MKTERADIEMYRSLMEHFQNESATKSARLSALSRENEALCQELAALRQTHRQDMEMLRRTHSQEMSKLRESHRQDMERLRLSHAEAISGMQASFEKRLDHMAQVNASLSMQVSDALASGKLARAKNYGRSSEQRDLLNNRKGTSRKSEEDDSDGTPPASGTVTGEASTAQASPRKSSGRKRKPEAPEGKMRYDAVIEHPMEEYMELPPGARLIGGTSVFELLKFIPAKVECHRYHFRRYILETEEDEAFGETLPREIRLQRPVASCAFSAELLAFIMTQKYAYHQPQKRIRAMLRDMGVRIPKKTLNRYFMKGATELYSLLGKTFRAEVRDGRYFMIDETVVPVGVKDEEIGRRYLDRYMWEFYNRSVNLVEYVYEDGSRGKKVLLSFFGDGPLPLTVISCDGYNAYRLFDDPAKYPEVTVVGCWTHARRNFVDALESCRPQCELMLDMIGHLFEIEAQCHEAGCDTDPDARLRYRKKRTGPVLKTIRATAERMWNDTGLMAVGLLKKAVGYLRNQWDHLGNILHTGIAEISNNYSEQRIRPLKLSLKNCLNIGSEKAARLHAFMYSLAESCRLNSVNIQDYFTCLFKKVRSSLTEAELISLLPNHYPREMLKMGNP